MDVLEIDGASNNSVDDVRELREVVRYIPTEGAHKIYIIDEVHMLSTAAFNALLKTLEEPPERVVFVFATTEVQEVPDTILSRCQRFNFRRIPTSTIAQHLEKISAAESIGADQEALYLLARRADGALRDAESLLDQVVSFGDRVTTDSVRDVLGLVDRGVFFDATEAMAAGDGGRLLDLVAQVIDEGGDIEEFVRGFVEHTSHMLFTKVQGSAAKLEVADTEAQRYESAVDALPEEDLLRVVQSLMELEAELRRSVQPRFRTEMALVRLAHMGKAVDVGRLLNRLAVLEAAVSGAGPAPEADRPAPRTMRPAPPPAPATAAASPTDPSGPEPPLPVPPPQSEELPTTPEAVAPPPPVSGSDLELTLREQWPRVTDHVRETQPSAGTFLQEITRLELEGSVLTLFFSPAQRFGMGQVAKASDAVAVAIAKVTGTEVRVRCSVDHGSGGQGDAAEVPPQAPSGDDTSPPPPADPPEGSTGDKPVDPKVRTVLDALDGELV
jgi:DNA polymerase-3 subunit gamma/tau